jgi:UDP-N-acetylmuramoylalanine--D-glutamate ligase
LVQAALSAGVPVWSEIELAYRFSQAPVIAITGSKGKSTTAALLGHLWQGAGRSGVVAGNIGLAYSAIVPQLRPDDWVILEVSSFQLETVHAFHPRVAVHLPVTPDHLDRYAGMQEYARAKARIAQCLTKDDLLVVDVTDPWSAQLAATTPARCIGFGTLCAATGVVQQDHALYWVDASSREMLCRVADLPLLGRHNVHNAMAALAVLRALQAWNPQAAQALGSFEGLAFRMQPCGEIEAVRFVNDSKSTTVESVRAAVQGLDGPLILALGGRNKGLDFAALRETLGQVRRVLVFGEAAAAISSSLHGAAAIETVTDLTALVDRALEIAAPGDTVLFSPGCTSFDMFENAEARGRAFTAAVDRKRQGRQP